MFFIELSFIVIFLYIIVDFDLVVVDEELESWCEWNLDYEMVLIVLGILIFMLLVSIVSMWNIVGCCFGDICV